MDKTPCKTSLKRTEEGRPCDPPEIVSADTNDDATTGRRIRSGGNSNIYTGAWPSILVPRKV